MNPEELPVVGVVVRAGPDDRVFDALLFLGPVAVLAVAVLGRSPPATAVAAGYVLALVCYVAYRAVRFEPG